MIERYHSSGLNENSTHRILAVINLKKKRFEQYDSMGGRDDTNMRNMKRWLKDEFMDKKKLDVDVSGWEEYVPRDIPHQRNGSDCGMFMCTFAESLARKMDFGFSQDTMPTLRRRCAAMILTRLIED